MMKKLFCILLSLMLFLLPAAAVGGARMPEMRGNINDSADVLSAQTVTDLAEFSKLVTSRKTLICTWLPFIFWMAWRRRPTRNSSSRSGT